MNESPRVVICFYHWGPYHFARLNRLTQSCPEGWTIDGLQLNEASGYVWGNSAEIPQNFHSLDLDGKPARRPKFSDIGVIRGYLDSRRPTHVFVTSYQWMSLLIFALARRGGARVIMMNDTLPLTARPGWFRRQFRRFAVRLFDGALVAGAPHLAHYEAMGVDRRHMATGLDVVDEGFFARHAADAREQGRDAAPTQKPYLLSVGRFESFKRVDLLIAAYVQLLEEFPDLALVIVGYGPHEQSLIDLCGHYGLHTEVDSAEVHQGRGSVIFKPRAEPDQLAALYGFAEVFVFCSEHETWGLVVNEALASGTRVVCSDAVGCAQDLVIGYDDSTVFRSGDLTELTSAISAFLASPPETRAIQDRPLNHLQCFADGVIQLVREI